MVAAGSLSADHALWFLLAMPVTGGLAVSRLRGTREKVGVSVATAATTLGGVSGSVLSWLTWHAGPLRVGPWEWVTLPGVRLEAALEVDQSAALVLTCLSWVVLAVHMHVSEDRPQAAPGVRSCLLGVTHVSWLGAMLVVLSQGNPVLLLGWGLGSVSVAVLVLAGGRQIPARCAILALGVGRFGDAALLGGLVILAMGSGLADTAPLAGPQACIDDCVVGCLLLVIGAVARCGQIPFHWRWLNAVTAAGTVGALVCLLLPGVSGVYLLLRTMPRLAVGAEISWMAAAAPLATALLVPAMALACQRLDQALVYSVSLHLGVALAAVAAGAATAGIYHLVVALPALGAVVSARRSGSGSSLFVIAALLLGGVLPLGASWSLASLAARASAHGLYAWAAVVAMGLTAGLVTGRLLVLARREAAADPAHSGGTAARPAVAATSLLVLLTAAAGPAGYLLGAAWFGPVPVPGLPDGSVWSLSGMPWGVGLALPLLASCVGCATVYVGWGPEAQDPAADQHSGVGGWLAAGLGLEQLIERGIVHPAASVARFLEDWVDVVGIGLLCTTGAGLGARALGWMLGGLHTGKARHALLAGALGAVAAVLYFALMG